MNENIRLLRPLLKGIPIILLIMFLGLLLAEKYLEYVTPMYESTAKLKLADNQEGVPSANTVKNSDAFTSTNKIATEIEVLKSSNLLKKTLKELPFGLEIYRKGKFKSVELFNNSPIIIKALSKSDKIYDKRFLINVLSLTKFALYDPIDNQEIECFFGKPVATKGGTFLITLNTNFIKSKKEIKIIDYY
ncbi:Wzz/FepE/Etk N-terminal domain-containing protein, partial [Flavobacterium collinsii]|uniref:Wzz/FepE/Etk N-terminal domain-containing protein n=1 Tax=Flavobacterium collinsii TaxID=1114861 RepID=UPI001C2D6B49